MQRRFDGRVAPPSGLRYSQLPDGFFKERLMTPDVMRALAISGSILVAVVLLIVVVSFVTVRRGEISMTDADGRGSSRH